MLRILCGAARQATVSNLTKSAQRTATTATATATATRTTQAAAAATTTTTTTTTTTSRGSANEADEPVDIPNPFEKERLVCILCKHGITPNYKNVKLLSQFQSPYTGRIYGRHITGLCKQKQAEVERAIMRAQNCALMPGYHKHLDFVKDPKLFDPEKPVRPHKY